MTWKVPNPSYISWKLYLAQTRCLALFFKIFKIFESQPYLVSHRDQNSNYTQFHTQFQTIIKVKYDGQGQSLYLFSHRNGSEAIFTLRRRKSTSFFTFMSIYRNWICSLPRRHCESFVVLTFCFVQQLFKNFKGRRDFAPKKSLLTKWDNIS